MRTGATLEFEDNVGRIVLPLGFRFDEDAVLLHGTERSAARSRVTGQTRDRTSTTHLGSLPSAITLGLTRRPLLSSAGVVSDGEMAKQLYRPAIGWFLCRVSEPVALAVVPPPSRD